MDRVLEVNDASWISLSEGSVGEMTCSNVTVKVSMDMLFCGR